MTSVRPAPFDVYAERTRRFTAERDRQARVSAHISRARVVLFLAAVAGALWAEESARAAQLGWIVAGVSLVAFFVLVAGHRRARARQRWFETLRAVNDLGLRRLGREWDALPLPPVRAEPDHVYARDLDLFGRASLFHLAAGLATPAGQATLASWLTAPAEPEVVRSRQEAVAELTPSLDLRDELAAHARSLGAADPKDVDKIARWMESPWLEHARPAGYGAWLFPAATIALIALHAAGGPPYLWALSLAGGLWSTRRVARRARTFFERASVSLDRLGRYGALFERLSRAAVRSPRLRELQVELTANGSPAHIWIRRLDRLADLANLRRSELAHLVVHPVTLWDVHVLRALERWRRSAGPHVRRWLQALGELDALCALAALAHDHPEWTFPELVEGDEPLLTAEGLGHPLLRPGECVVNDVEVGPPGTFLLVTGSNMSGKSTLLRALGTNVALAQAGGPVFARRMRLPPIEVHTGMRMEDSLERGVSQFMAELHRLSRMVEAARRARAQRRRTVLFLLDDILQGTNHLERHRAVRRVAAGLLQERATGLLTTHDLSLADAPEIAAACRPVHFRDVIRHDRDRPALSFDYRLRPGLTRTTNALRLMDMLGFDPVEPDGPEEGDSLAR